MLRRILPRTVLAILLMLWASGCVRGRTQDTPPERPAPTSTPIEQQEDRETSEAEPTPEPPTPTTPPTVTAPSPIQAPTEMLPPDRPTLPPAPTSPPIAGEQVLPGTALPVTLAVADLAARLGVAASDIEVVSTQHMNWPDASLGCPQPGFMYAQVITPGWLIQLAAAGETFEYHTDQGMSVVLCEDASQPDVSSIDPSAAA